MHKKYFLLLLVSSIMFSQPYVDIATFNYQHFSAPYSINSGLRNTTTIYNLNLFFPKEFKNGNALLFRLNNELIVTQINSNSTSSSSISSITALLGYQFTSKSKKWKTILMAIPKLASDFEDPISTTDWQIGGLLLGNYKANDKLKIKAGLYYNREAFGDFFVPLLGIDWKATDRLNFYGTLPNNYKIEYAVVKNKFFTGLNFKSQIRSFQLAQKQNNDYVRFDETVLKLFADYFLYKKVLVFSEIGYSLGKSPLQYSTVTNELTTLNSIYSPSNKYPVFNIGIAYRIRTDLEK
jgi:Domain of unknown function (DUF6268)